MSKLLKERIIYITSIALGVLTIALLFVPFMSSWISVTTNGVTAPKEFIYNGFDIIFNIDPTGGYEIEGIMRLLLVITGLAALASLAWGGLALYNNIKNPEKFFGKKFFILFQLIYVACVFCNIIVLVNFVNAINTSDDPISGYSLCLFACVTGSQISAFPCIFIIAGFGLVAFLVTCVFSAKAQDNSLVLPYKRREVISSIITIVACVLVIFIPLFTFVYNTNHINTNASNIFQFALGSGSDLTSSYVFVNGYDMFYLSGGGFVGYIKLLYYVMLFIGIAGIAYNIAFLLGALKVFHFNFDRKLNNLINVALSVCGVMITVGCVALCIGVNFQLDRNWETYSVINPLQTIWTEGHFTYSYPFAGAFVVLYPLVSYVGVRLVNDYLD
jgi:hypothetical protein